MLLDFCGNFYLRPEYTPCGKFPLVSLQYLQGPREECCNEGNFGAESCDSNFGLISFASEKPCNRISQVIDRTEHKDDVDIEKSCDGREYHSDSSRIVDVPQKLRRHLDKSPKCQPNRDGECKGEEEEERRNIAIHSSIFLSLHYIFIKRQTIVYIAIQRLLLSIQISVTRKALPISYSMLSYYL